MPTTPGLGTNAGGNLATAIAGLSTQDRYEVTGKQRQITSAYQRANRTFNTGLQSARNDQSLGLKRAVMGLQQNRNLGLSQAADSGFGTSPAVAGAAIAAAGQQYALGQANVNQDFATAQGVLQRMLDEAGLSQAEAESELVREAARRRDYANEIRRLSA